MIKQKMFFSSALCILILSLSLISGITQSEDSIHKFNIRIGDSLEYKTQLTATELFDTIVFSLVGFVFLLGGREINGYAYFLRDNDTWKVTVESVDECSLEGRNTSIQFEVTQYSTLGPYMFSGKGQTKTLFVCPTLGLQESWESKAAQSHGQIYSITTNTSLTLNITTHMIEYQNFHYGPGRIPSDANASAQLVYDLTTGWLTQAGLYFEYWNGTTIYDWKLTSNGMVVSQDAFDLGGFLGLSLFVMAGLIIVIIMIFSVRNRFWKKLE